MSGIEVAGLVLGALPVLLKAVEQYRGTIQAGIRFIKKRKYVERLANALLLQKGTLTEVLRFLLINAGLSDVARLDAAPFEYLKDSRVQSHLHDYLGTEINAALMSTLQQSLYTIKKIANNISGLVLTVNVGSHSLTHSFVMGPNLAQGTTDDLLEIIKANCDTESRKLDLIPRIKLMFGANELKSAIEELDTTAAGLQRLSSLVVSNRRPVEAESSRRTTELAGAFRKVRNMAGNLHTAINRGWNANCSHRRHDAHMLLEDRLDAAASLSKRMKSNKSDVAPAFNLIFAGPWTGRDGFAYNTVVRVMNDHHEEEDDTALSSLTSSRTSKVAINIPKDYSATSIIASIDDLCTAFTTTGVAFVLTRNQTIGIINSHTECTVSCRHEQITLKELLCDTEPTRRTPVIPLKMRMLLALNLASNLLQLLETQWLQNFWSKELISFPVVSVQNQKTSKIDFTRPYVTSTFEHAKPAANPAPSSTVEPKVAILELGILLLEIWHEKSLEAHFSLKQNPTKFHERLALALEWIGETDNPLLELYDRAVTYCLTGVVGSESRNMHWGDMKLWTAICKDVIEPLSKNCKQWR